jgi:hypothetical protein
MKPLVVGGIGGLYTMYRYPLGTIDLFSYSMPLSLGIFGALTLGSFVADLIHDYIFPNVGVDDKVSEPVSAAVSGVGNSIAVAGIFYLSSPEIVNTLGLPMIALLGVGSEVGGTYLYEKFVQPMLSR